MPSLTRRGALSVTQDLDKLANLFQSEHQTLGVPQEYAHKFAYYCDVMSDAIEKTAVANAKRAEEEVEEEVEEESDAEAGKKAAKSAASYVANSEKRKQKLKEVGRCMASRLYQV